MCCAHLDPTTFSEVDLETGDSRIQISRRQSDMCDLHSSALWFKSHATKQDVWGRGRECELPISRRLLTRQQGSRKEWEANHFSGRFKVPQSGIPFSPAAFCGLVFILSFIKGGNCTCAIMSRLFPFTVSWIKMSQTCLERLELGKYKGVAEKFSSVLCDSCTSSGCVCACMCVCEQGSQCMFACDCTYGEHEQGGVQAAWHRSACRRELNPAPTFRLHGENCSHASMRRLGGKQVPVGGSQFPVSGPGITRFSFWSVSHVDICYEKCNCKIGPPGGSYRYMTPSAHHQTFYILKSNKQNRKKTDRWETIHSIISPAELQRRAQRAN